MEPESEKNNHVYEERLEKGKSVLPRDINKRKKKYRDIIMDYVWDMLNIFRFR